MSNLDKSYIANKFKLPETTLLVIFDGIYQPQLSDQTTNAIIEENNLTIPKNTKVIHPIHLLFLTSQNSCCFFEVIAKENSYITIIEEHASLGEGQYINETKTQITTKTNSEIVHYKLQLEDTGQAGYRNTINVNQGTGSKITSYFINKGAKAVQDTLHINLAEENATIDITGINLLRDHQNMSCYIKIEHQQQNCTSNVLFKSIVDDQAINNFVCQVIAHSGVSKTRANVSNKNLLLSEFATVNTAPKQEVYADDVLCTHGATVGQLDQEALFYLRSRGIAESSARSILISAFAKEIVDQFTTYDRFKTAVTFI